MTMIIQGRILGLITSAILVGAIFWFMSQAASGKIPTLRRLAAVNVIEEILARGVEMGRPSWYLMGSTGMTSPSVLAPTVATFQILSYTARMAARLGAKFFVPVGGGIAYTIANEIVEEAYLAEGKHEDYDPLGSVLYIPGGALRMYVLNNLWSQEVTGCFLLGSWYHEAVIYSEAAARVGALQLGGTDTTHNIPFLVAICDYSIIGEELYALGAYVSEDPLQSASLAGQDFGKYIVVALCLVGSLLATIGVDVKGIFGL